MVFRGDIYSVNVGMVTVRHGLRVLVWVGPPPRVPDRRVVGADGARLPREFSVSGLSRTLPIVARDTPVPVTVRAHLGRRARVDLVNPQSGQCQVK